MKKILAILLAVIMLFAVVSCGKGEEETESTGKNEAKNEDVYTDEESGDKFTYDVNDDGKYEIISFSSKNNTPHKIEIPAKIDNVEVSGIAASAFKANNQITEVVIPDSVTYIGDLAFWNCEYLTTVSIPDSVEEMGACVFNNCSSLKTVKLSASLTTITECTFLNCEALEEITIPSSVTKIESGAFMLCTSLKEVVIPESVIEIEDVAFYGDTLLQKATLSSKTVTLGKHIFNAGHAEFTIVVDENSAAAQYAADNGYLFVKAEAAQA